MNTPTLRRADELAPVISPVDAARGYVVVRCNDASYNMPIDPAKAGDTYYIRMPRLAQTRAQTGEGA